MLHLKKTYIAVSFYFTKPYSAIFKVKKAIISELYLKH